MKINIEINDDLMAKAKKLSNIKNESTIIEQVSFMLLLKLREGWRIYMEKYN